MRFNRMTTVSVLLAILATSVGVTGAQAKPQSSKEVIVWTQGASLDSPSKHLVISRADGSGQRNLTAPLPDTTDIDAQISPDGSWIAYQRETPDSATIRLVRPDGTRDHVVDVGCVDPCVAAIGPTWLSDTRLAFTLVKGPFPNDIAASVALYSSRLDGSQVRRLSPPGIDGIYEDVYLHVSPDRSYLTFLRIRPADGKTALFRMTPTGRDLRQLTPWGIGAEVNDLSTARSGPTADVIVFESYGRGDPDATFVDLATVPATCKTLASCISKIRWLTDNGATGRRNANPQWSPDGTSLVFTDRPSIDAPNADIWTMKYLGKNRSQISTGQEFDYRPTWGVSSSRGHGHRH